MKYIFTVRNMNIKAKRLLLAGTIAVTATIGMNAALTKDFYKSNSVLEKDKWVKVGVEKTGVYEISYETLRNMGFNDPSKVSVYGRGGRVLPESFVTNAGVPTLTDDLQPVSIIHEDNKIYFYGLGPEEITFETNTDYPTGGYFNRKGNNIYTRRGYYFLTDSKPVQNMKTQSNSTSASSKLIDKGVSYVYHELDSVQNTTLSGQLFWGERIGLPQSTKRSWAVDMPDALAGTGVMQCVMYIAEEDYVGDARLNYGFENTENYSSTPFAKTGALYYTPALPTVSSIEIPAEPGKVFVEFTGRYNGVAGYSNLDYWVVSYDRNIPSFDEGGNRSQQLMALPQITKNTTGRLELKNASSLVVFDVTTPGSPERVNISALTGGNGELGIKNTNKTPVIVVFDKEMPQYEISGYEQAYTQVANQNLHALKDKGADFIIITVPKFRSYAEEIANLHRQYDGIEVVVATTEECYNEFSAGVPDPMAYRSFAKMLNYSDRKPKNMLLLGPLYADFRGLVSERDPLEGIIAFQSPSISLSRGAHNINDFYGVMTDKFNTDYYERNEVSIGVGIMPVKFESEARIVVDKIRSYLERDDHAYYLNRYTAVGGIGDEHTHDTQVRDINNHIRNLDNMGTIFTPLAIDTYGNKEAHKKFINQLEAGCNIFSYFGHGAEAFMGLNGYFFNAGDVAKLRNRTLPIALFGGCQITNSDRGFRGIGETIVTNTEYGCIGAVVSARETWSGQNYDFFKQFFTCLYKQGSSSSSAHRENPVTIGEVYASVKNYSTLSNELAYQLLCDPALVFPIINRKVSVSATDFSQGESALLTPGEKFRLSGKITYMDGRTDNQFNGTLVLRLNEPEKVISAGKIESGQDPKELKFTYRDEQVSMMTAEVKNGEFDIDIHVPSTLSTYGGTGKQALLYFSAYDPTTKVGAGAGYGVGIKALENGASTSESEDVTPPVIETFAFSGPDCFIDVAVSDNLALNVSNNPLNKGLYLFIDGQEYSPAHFVDPVFESGRAAYSKHIFIDNLTFGEHSARLKVKDLAGNYAESEILFTYEPRRAKFNLRRDELSGEGFTRILVDSAAIPGEAKIVILSPKGEEIWSGACASDGSLEWNHTDYNGTAVAPGHYKAYLIETGTNTLKGHSDPIDVPVI